MADKVTRTKEPEEYTVYMTDAERKAEAAKHDAECETPECGGCKEGR